MSSISKFKSITAAVFLLIATALSTEFVSAQSNKLPVADAKNLVGFKQNGTLSAEQINQRVKTVFGASALSAASKAVDLYKISYRSQNEKGTSVVLTGLIAMPQSDAPKGLVIFNHGTFADRDLSPSRWTGKANSSETEIAALAFTSGGYAVAMPDYLGLGDDKEFHPYPLGAVNSLSAIDLIQPARTVAARNGVALGSRLFITGYSEGGAVAMWTVKELENKFGTQYAVTAAAPLSGSYDLSGATRKWLLASPTDQAGFVTRLYLSSYIAQSFHKNNGVKLTDYFKPSMALTVSQAYKTNRSDEDIIKRLALAATLMRAKNSLENVLTNRFVEALRKSDMRDPIIKGLRNNDVYDWSPRTKMLLVNLEDDKIVDPDNTDNVFRTMRKRGVGNDTLSRFIIKDRNLNHITAVAPALLQARRFFDEF
ncbi:MAG: prolyl oligopeptidase family serine peptidase [Acidobacteriota bacterium]